MRTFTVEEFNTLPKISAGRVLSLKELKESRSTRIVEHVEVLKNEMKTHFFSTNHCFGGDILPKNFVPTSTTLPLRIAPREGFENGIVATPEDYIRFMRHCEPDAVFIETIEELVNYLNEHYSQTTVDRALDRG